MDTSNGDVVVDPGSVEMLDAFKSTYERIGLVAGQAKDAATYAFALAELLISRGVIGVDELETARRRVDTRIAASHIERGLTISVADDDTDKYSVEPFTGIDCNDRIPVCQGACCRLRFPLSEQDIVERVVQWSPGEPYQNRQGPDGFCVHSSRENGSCMVYEARPLICRTYDCRQDTRIWKDFEARELNPDLVELLAKLHESGVPVATPRVRQPATAAPAEAVSGGSGI